jgi:D-serine deaminase-like pyridoxal phosphate-dependent protein
MFSLAKGFKFAASVLTRVNSRPTDHSFTFDAGSKALAAESTWPIACVAGNTSWVGRCPSEEHFPFDAPKGNAPAAGSLCELHPMHVCPTVNLAETAMLMEGDKLIKLVSVAARAHAAGPL